jgi:hypothetical protein
MESTRSLRGQEIRRRRSGKRLSAEDNESSIEARYALDDETMKKIAEREKLVDVPVGLKIQEEKNTIDTKNISSCLKHHERTKEINNQIARDAPEKSEDKKEKQVTFEEIPDKYQTSTRQVPDKYQTSTRQVPDK